ncbi:hypothetical protein AAZX31_07G047800 [Glycine max]
MRAPQTLSKHANDGICHQVTGLMNKIEDQNQKQGQ